MTTAGYLVCDEPRGLECWLKLVGPFQYDHWVSRIDDATSMPFVMANDYAAAYGKIVHGENRARVVATHRAPRVVKAMIDKLEEAAMKAQEAAMIDMCWTSEGA